MRRRYLDKGGELRSRDLAGDWLAQFQAWFEAAAEAGLPEPNAMILGTAGADGRPSARTVLLKGLDEEGFVFYTNYTSRKATELDANPYASLVFPWYEVFRQVIVRGTVERVDRATTEAYFASRPRESQIGAWASPQSQVVPDRDTIDRAEREAAARFEGADVPAPPHWGGLRVRPETVEFWQGRTGRLHDRLRYRRVTGDEWIVERLAP
ncbi:MAG TPA: pyridoxamine 5'-phosphate oxidase [Micromonosporaceae bacterium]|nr:pyridoxamine 5'-phosphate oxidase [Micromonosporaceae bacterium]